MFSWKQSGQNKPSSCAPTTRTIPHAQHRSEACCYIVVYCRAKHDVRGVTACACASAVSDTRGQRTRRLQLLSPEGDESAATSARPSSNPAAHCTKFSTSCVPCACHPTRTKNKRALDFLPSEKWGGACYCRTRQVRGAQPTANTTIQVRPLPAADYLADCILHKYFTFVSAQRNQPDDR